VLQTPDVTLKMSTALEPPAQCMRLAHTQSTQHTPPHSSIPNSSCHMQEIKQEHKTCTFVASKNGDAQIRQRCGCKMTSTYAESCSAPNPRRHVEDVHNVEDQPICARHEARAHTINKTHSPILKHSPSQSRPHAGHRQSTKHHALCPPAKIATP
jgi:hypothetical protein